MPALPKLMRTKTPFHKITIHAVHPSGYEIAFALPSGYDPNAGIRWLQDNGYTPTKRDAGTNQLDPRKNERKVRIGAYAMGKTADQRADWVLLFLVAKNMQNKAVKVYEDDFHLLPFDPYAPDPPFWLGKTNPTRDEADDGGYLYPVPPFTAVLADGRDTQMGKQVVLSRVIPETHPTRIQASQPTPKLPHPKVTYRQQAIDADNDFMFDTAMAKLEPWYQNSDNVRVFRILITKEATGGEALTEAMLLYASNRNKGMAHEEAKGLAIAKYQSLKVVA